MQYKKFGNTDLQPSVIGLGGASLLSRTSRSESIKALNEAYDLGITFYDTADSYGQGGSEKIIGEVFKKRRDKVIIATKAGNYLQPGLQFIKPIKPFVRSIIRQFPGMRNSAQNFVTSQTSQNFEPSYITNAIEASLRRLQSDYIDIFLLHSPSKQIIEKGELFKLLDSFNKQGKIRYYGVSCSSIEDALACLKYAGSGLSALQVTISMFEQHAINNLLPVAQQKGVAIVARKVFAHGQLIPHLNGNCLTPAQHDLPSSEEFAFLLKNGTRTMLEAALQFVLQLEGVSVVLPGMSKATHVHQNIVALKQPPLTPQDIEKIRLIWTNWSDDFKVERG